MKKYFRLFQKISLILKFSNGIFCKGKKSKIYCQSLFKLKLKIHSVNMADSYYRNGRKDLYLDQKANLCDRKRKKDRNEDPESKSFYTKTSLKQSIILMLIENVKFCNFDLAVNAHI